MGTGMLTAMVTAGALVWIWSGGPGAGPAD